MMTNDPDRIFKIANSLPRVEKDIDVLFVGGRVHEHNRPFCWPKNRDISRWWPGNRKTGYEKLIDIRSRRHDLKIELHDGLVEPSKYYDLINRSKICVDFPGIGLSSRKFYEFMVLGKCVIALKQHIQSWPLEEWTHYASMGSDYLWNDLEQTIDFLLQNEEMRRKLETNAASLRPLMSHESVAQYVVKKIDDHISIRSGDPSIFEDLRPRYT
jgi:hypothetical protein